MECFEVSAFACKKNEGKMNDKKTNDILIISPEKKLKLFVFALHGKTRMIEL